jgi:hypothetical protein
MIISFFSSTHKNMYQFTRSAQQAPNNSDVKVTPGLLDLSVDLASFVHILPQIYGGGVYIFGKFVHP